LPARDERCRPSPVVLQALSSPIRLHMLEAAIKEPDRKFSATRMKDVLAREFREHLKVGEVHYHLRRLEAAGLLPRPLAGG
jgi:DNA-binding transcriptional ArsR family regulator